jgi:hypothetical protein
MRTVAECTGEGAVETRLAVYVRRRYSTPELTGKSCFAETIGPA